MKKHTGCSMQYEIRFKGLCQQLLRPDVTLSKRAEFRLKVLDWYRLESKKYSYNNKPNVELTSRHFGIAHSTIYYWISKFNPHSLISLEDKSKRPKKLRSSSVSFDVIEKINEIRQENKTYSKDKIHTILLRDNPELNTPSISTIGRIIKRYNMFYNSDIPKHKSFAKSRRTSKTQERKRLTEKLRACDVDSIIEYDMKHVTRIGNKLYAMCGIDQLSKRPVIHITRTPSSNQSVIALQKIVKKFGKNIVIINDNGSENMKNAEEYLLKEGITQFWTRPCQPKDKPFIERFIGTFQRECLAFHRHPMTVEELQHIADEWVEKYEDYRPHASLGGLTPNEFYNRFKKTSQNISG